MKLRLYICVSLLNLCFLAAGIGIDRLIHSGPVYAQASPPPPSEYEEISPIMTVGSAGIGTLLANRVASDQIMANGYDVLKLDEGILQLIQRKTFATDSELQGVVDRAKVAHPLRAKVASPSPSQAPPKGPGK